MTTPCTGVLNVFLSALICESRRAPPPLPPPSEGEGEGGGLTLRRLNMSDWQKTSCVLCFNNCGLEVITEGNKIVKVRGEKENPRSQGYVCRKGANIAYFQNNPERLKF